MEPAIDRYEFYRLAKGSWIALFFGSALAIAIIVANVRYPDLPPAIVVAALSVATLIIGYNIVYLPVSQTLSLYIEPQNGLWTKETGFVNWGDIEKAYVVKETGDFPALYLELYIKQSSAFKRNNPDFKIYVSNLEGCEYISTLIDSHFNFRQQIIND